MKVRYRAQGTNPEAETKADAEKKKGCLLVWAPHALLILYHCGLSGQGWHI